MRACIVSLCVRAFVHVCARALPVHIIYAIIGERVSVCMFLFVFIFTPCFLYVPVYACVFENWCVRVYECIHALFNVNILLYRSFYVSISPSWLHTFEVCISEEFATILHKTTDADLYNKSGEIFAGKRRVCCSTQIAFTLVLTVHVNYMTSCFRLWCHWELVARRTVSFHGSTIEIMGKRCLIDYKFHLTLSPFFLYNYYSKFSNAGYIIHTLWRSICYILTKMWSVQHNAKIFSNWMRFPNACM